MHFTLICARYSATTFATCGLALPWCSIQVVALKCGLFPSDMTLQNFQDISVVKPSYCCVCRYDMLINHSINIKNEMTITFPEEETTFAFLGVGDGDFHTELCCLLSE